MKNTLKIMVGGSLLILAMGAQADQVILDDLIVDGSACIGFDCVNGESFGFDTLRLKENNLRINFADTSTSASFPTNDWRIIINDTANGGGAYFGIEDSTGGRIPFRVEAGARTNALYVESDGDIGIGTNNPVVDVHVVNGNTPTLRLDQDGSSGFTPQVWDVAGNEANFFIRDVTNGSTLPFRIRPGAPSSTIDVAADGDIGFGTTSPDSAIHISRSGASSVRYEDTATNAEWEFGLTSNTSFKLSEVNTTGVQFRFTNEGMINMRAQASAPTLNVAQGSIYTDSSGALCWYSGSAWVVIAGTGSCS